MLEFYADDAFYSDPGVPNGVRGHEELLAHFTKLLAANPEWVWTQTGSVPMRDGFLNKWRARIPIGDVAIECDGVCTVELREGLIVRNEVFFDRSALLMAIAKLNRAP